MAGAAGDIFIQTGLVFIVAAVAGFIFRLLKQPQLLAYVLVGVLLTPLLGLVTDTSIIESMSTIGLAFLLFIVGLEMDLKSLKSVAFVASIGGTIQVFLTFVIGYLVALMLGLVPLEGIYTGLALAFSSTMVVLKLLSDRKELHTLHGRIVIGILLIQDIVAIFALSILVSIGEFSVSILGTALLKFFAMFALAYLASRYVFKHVFKFAAKNQELLLVTALAVCFIFSLGFHYLGFSIAIGAFLAGISLGNLEYHMEIIAKMKSLKDFFALLFFVSLGMGLSLEVISRQWLAIIVLLIAAVIIKPMLIMLICSLFKYTKKPSFLTANALAQIGEFSLILVTQGKLLGHISQDLFSIIVFVTLLTISLTSYYIEYARWFYRVFEKPLSIFDRFTTEGLEFAPKMVEPKIILCGHSRIGYSILKNLENNKKRVLIIDFNPEVIANLAEKKYHCIYGDATDEEILEKANLSRITMFISTLPELKDNYHLIKKVRDVNKRAKIIVTGRSIEDAFHLYKHGADYVIIPHFLGGERVAELITNFHAKKTVLHKERKRHIDHLHERKKAGRHISDN